MKQKGQEEGPFELLIAVILMTFVIFIGIQAMDILRVQTCEGKAEKAKGVDGAQGFGSCKGTGNAEQ